MAMRLVVDLTRCQGYGQCAFLAPDVFQMRGSEALWDNSEPDDAQQERVLRAAAACPVQAIRVDRIDATDRAAAMVSGSVAAAARSKPTPRRPVPPQLAGCHGRSFPPGRPHRDRGRVAGWPGRRGIPAP